MTLLSFFRLNLNQNIAAHDRLTIYFHAVLSKDFKFNPKEDRIFIEAGRIIGTWESCAVELFVTRYVHNTTPLISVANIRKKKIIKPHIFFSL